MGHVREERAIKIYEDVILDWLEEGKIPTSEELQKAFDERSAEFIDNVRSGIRLSSLPQRYSESSASEFGKILDAFNGDIEVILRAMMAVTSLSTNSLAEWNIRAKSTQIRLEALKSRVDSLLLMKSLAAGYVSFVEDNFFSLEEISEDTTANIDTVTGEVTLNVDRSYGEGNVQGTRINLQGAHVTWAILEGGNVRYTAPVSGASLREVLSDTRSAWGMDVITRPSFGGGRSSERRNSVTGEMKIAFPEMLEFSKISIIMADGNSGQATVISGQYSLDGYTWSNLEDRIPTLSGTGNFVWRFPPLSAKFVKFIFSKSSPDEVTSSGGRYSFGVQQVKVYSEIFEVTSEGVSLVTETRFPTLAGTSIPFGRCSLEVCEDIPNGTSIRYFLRAYDGASFTNWMRVVPMNRTPRTINPPSLQAGAGEEDVPLRNPPSPIVDFTAPVREDSDDSSALFESALQPGALNIFRTQSGSELTYSFDDPNMTLANFYIPYSDEVLSDLVLLRNIGYPAGKFPLVSTDLLVGDIECGWGLEGDGIYYCEFRIDDPSGRYFDFGENSAFVDGVSVSGTAFVSSGWHTFRTNRSNWYSISGTAPTTLAELKEADPLYPYNHKYIIEGYTYPSTFAAEEGVYIGVDYYCQAKAYRVGKVTLQRNEFSPLTYALDTVDGPRTYILLKFDSSRANYENERVRLFYNRRPQGYTGLQFRAVLKTKNATRTPSLSYYRVMVK